MSNPWEEAAQQQSLRPWEEAAATRPTAPGTMTGNTATIGAAPSSYQPKVYSKGEGEGFIDRMTSRFGQNLESAGQAIMHPLDTITSMMSAKGDVGPFDTLPKQYAKDPANLAGDVMTGVMSTVMGNPPGINMATAGRSLRAPVERPAPLWQTAGTTPTEPLNFWEKSSPADIKEQLQRMAARPRGPQSTATRPAPSWQTAEPSGTTISVQGSTPEEIQANVHRMAANRAARQAQAAPAATVGTTPPPGTVAESEFGAPSGITNPLHGESALSNLLTQVDNQTLLKIAKSRGIPTAQLSMLKPGVANPRLIKSIISDFSPDELSEISAQTIENGRFGHQFGNISDEAWRTIALSSYFPSVKLPQAMLRRAAISIQKGGK